MAEEQPLNLSDESDSEQIILPEIQGVLSKWTNYIHGWQNRFIVLKDGTLSYYKNEQESGFGCRGAISLLRASIKGHEFDECRFDVSVNDCVWYMRAASADERKHWVRVLEAYKSDSGYGSEGVNGSTGGTVGSGNGGGGSSSSSSGGTLRRHGSTASLASLRSLHSDAAAEHLAEIDFVLEQIDQIAESLARYVVREETAALNDSTTTGIPIAYDAMRASERPSSVGEREREREREAEACEALGEAASAAAALRAAASRGRRAAGGARDAVRRLGAKLAAAKRRLRRAHENTKSMQEQVKLARLSSHPGPDLEEGPNSTLPEDEFYDAVETELDKMEEEREARLRGGTASNHSSSPPVSTSPDIEPEPLHHHLWPEMVRISAEQLAAAEQAPGLEAVGAWQLFAEDGDMRMYRREVELDGAVVDPLKAVHRVCGVSARELTHFFFAPQYRRDWETTLEEMTVVEKVCESALLFHQTHKRIWPAAQRDALFWSRLVSVSEEDAAWAVVNHSTTRPDYPANEGRCLRVYLTVCLLCRTSSTDGKPLTASTPRSALSTSIVYCSSVNPGGWAPASVLRAVYKREYPKFLKRFTQYVIDQCRDVPVML